MPDRAQGYVKSKRVLEFDLDAAIRYRSRQLEETVCFNAHVQAVLIDELRVASQHRRYRLHGVATDPSHLHVLLSWIDERGFELVRRGVRESITRRLNTLERRRWLIHRGSRRRIRDHRHFDHLMESYLPSHRGACWFETDHAE